MSDEVDSLLSILGKEGHAAMDYWIPTDPADKMMLGSSLTTWKVPWIERYLPVLESMSWQMSRRGQIGQLMHLLIVYANLLAMH